LRNPPQLSLITHNRSMTPLITPSLMGKTKIYSKLVQNFIKS